MAHSRRRRIALFATALAVACVAALAAFEMFRFRARRGGTANAPVAVNWPESLGALAAAELAYDLGLTDSPRRLAVHFWLTDAPACFVPGAHLIAPGPSAVELTQMLCRAAARPSRRVTVVEGLHRFAIAERLEKSGVVAAAAFVRATEDITLAASLGVERSSSRGVESVEGLLFPATYELRQDSAPADVVRRMVTEFDTRYRALAANVTSPPIGPSGAALSRREIVTLASIVEREAVVAEERALIAGVFLNRLHDRAFRRLESDPTAMYGCVAMPEKIPSCRDFNGRASPAINRDAANPYSTYTNEGLPPGPIASPGEAALASVLSPAATGYRYFVAKGGGRHTFSETYPEHLEAVRKLRESSHP